MSGFAVAYSPSGELLTYAGGDYEHNKVTTVATATWEPVHTIAAEGLVPPRALPAEEGGSHPGGQRAGRARPAAAERRERGPHATESDPGLSRGSDGDSDLMVLL